MNHAKFIEAVAANSRRGLELMERKNTDYTGPLDAFGNFKDVSKFGVSVEQGIMVRMSDKMNRIATLLYLGENGTAKVADEKITDTLLDLMNYANILLTYIQSTDEKAND